MPKIAAKPILPSILADLARIASEDLALRPMLQRVADALALHFSWQFVALVSVDHGNQRFVCEALTTALPTDIHVGYSRELGSGVVGEVALTGQHVLVHDARKHKNFVHTLPGGRSELCVPISHRGQVVAVLNLESTEVGTFDDSVDLLNTIAAQIAGAIASARRFEELTRHAELLEVVAEFTRQAMESTDLDSLLDFVLGFLSSRFGTVEATVLLEGDLIGHLEVMAHHGASPHITYRGKQWPIAMGIVGRCFREAETLFVPDVRSDPNYATVNSKVVAELALPITLRGRTFGVLNLEAESASHFDGEHRVLLRALADSVAGAIHLLSTAERLQQSQQRAERQANELGRARENLRRAVGKLDRRQGAESVFGLLSESLFRKRLSAECRAVARGGRSLALMWLRLDGSAEVPARRMLQLGLFVAEELHRLLAQQTPSMARFGDQDLAILISGAPAQEHRPRMEQAMAALLQSVLVSDYAEHADRLSAVAMSCKVSQATQPESFLADARAMLGLAVPGRMQWIDAHAPTTSMRN